MLLFSSALIIGLVLLIVSSNKFIENAAFVAEKLNVSPMVIGIILVGLGTSIPEMVVSAVACVDNVPNIAIGNALGSNIANIALVFGTTLLFSAIPVKKELLYKEVPLVLIITLITGWLIHDNYLSFSDGIILVVCFVFIMTIMLKNNKNLKNESVKEPLKNINSSVTKLLIISIMGLIVLIAGSKLLIWGAIGIASTLGVSTLIIGLTIVAVSTSLPELAASISSVRKGHHAIAIGNIIGSNMFNLVTVLPLPALISPGIIDYTSSERDYCWVLGLTIVMAALICIFAKTKNKSIPRWVGIPLITYYAVYLFFVSTGYLI